MRRFARAELLEMAEAQRAEIDQFKAASDYYTFSDLRKGRGWSEKLIRDLLGEPDDTRPNPFYKTGPHPMRLYVKSRVHAAEQEPRFVAYQARRNKQSKAGREAAEKKRVELMQWAESVPITVTRLPMQEVFARSLKSRQAWHEYQNELRGRFEDYFDGANADEATRIRWAVNYIRHELTAYDDALLKAHGQVGVDAAAAIIKIRVLSEIAKIYPELEDECDRQDSEI